MIRARRAIFYALATISVSVSSLSAQEFGTFSDLPVVQLLEDGRNIRLLENFWYVAPDGVRWEVPEQYVANGASIPRVFWTFTGGPLVGKYRDASIVHDYFTESRRHDWRTVHQNFYFGMRASGVSEAKAWIMYKAVNTFGGRWETVVTTPPECESGPLFDPELCVFNAEPEIIDTTLELNDDSFSDFLEELRNEGYSEEADILQEEYEKLR